MSPPPLRLGAFARAFARPDLEATLAAAQEAGYASLHFGLAVAGLPSAPEPEALTDTVCARVRESFAAHELELFSLSGTFNAVHSDPAARADATRRAVGLVTRAPAFGAGAVGLSTGTRSTDSPWTAHPDNGRPEAWRDLRATLIVLLEAAEAAEVDLLVEPEPGNVVASAPLAARLLAELPSPRLRIVLDPANLVAPEDLSRQDAILEEAFELLGPAITAAHAKDVAPDGSGFVTPGTGGLDWEGYVERLRAAGVPGPLIVQDTPPERLAGARAFLAGITRHREESLA